MRERFAVVFANGADEAAGALEIEEDSLLLSGGAGTDEHQIRIPFADLTEVRIARRRADRLNGHSTLILERRGLDRVRVAPLGMAVVTEIADLLGTLTRPLETEMLAVRVPLKPGCLERARRLLAKGPPLDPAWLGLRGHEVYLREEEAVFVFHGRDVSARVSQAMRHPTVWRAGLAWQRCLAGAPRVLDPAELSLDGDPAYRWPTAD